jgi:hypothetical protein
MPLAEVVEGVGKVEGGFVAFVCPIINGMGTGPWAETAVGEWARFAVVVEHVDESLRGQMDIEGEVDEYGVHDDGESSFALLDNGICENGLVVANRSVISILEVGLEVRLSGRSVAECRCSGGEDALEVGPDVSIDDGAELS